MANQGIHRSTPNSKAGRSMIRVGKTVNEANISQEIREWNAQVDARKREKARPQIEYSTGAHSPTEPVQQNRETGQWWYWTAKWEDSVGPFSTEKAARDAHTAYCAKL